MDFKLAALTGDFSCLWWSRTGSRLRRLTACGRGAPSSLLARPVLGALCLARAKTGRSRRSEGHHASTGSTLLGRLPPADACNASEEAVGQRPPKTFRMINRRGGPMPDRLLRPPRPQPPALPSAWSIPILWLISTFVQPGRRRAVFVLVEPIGIGLRPTSAWLCAAPPPLRDGCAVPANPPGCRRRGGWGGGGYGWAEGWSTPTARATDRCWPAVSTRSAPQNWKQRTYENTRAAASGRRGCILTPW